VERSRDECRLAIRSLRPISEIPVCDRPMYMRLVEELAREYANPTPRWAELDEEGKLLRVGY